MSEAVSQRRLAEHGPDVGLVFEIRPDFTTKALVQTAAGAIFVRSCTQATTMPMNTHPDKVENVGGWTGDQAKHLQISMIQRAVVKLYIPYKYDSNSVLLTGYPHDQCELWWCIKAK